MFKIALSILAVSLMSLSALSQTTINQKPDPGNERGGEVMPPKTTHPKPLPRVEKTLKETVAPFQQWSGLGAHAQGLLVMDSVQGIPVMNSYGMLGTYRFVTNDDSPVMTYFPSKGEGADYTKNWNVPASQGYTADVAQFGKDTPNSLGLSQDVHIVDIEVNGGNGSTGYLSLAASQTRLSVVDAYLQPGLMLNNFLKPYSDLNSEANVKITTALDEILADKKKNDLAYAKVSTDDSKPLTEQGFMINLSQEGTQLKMTYYVNRSYQMVRSPVYRCPNCGGGTVVHVGGCYGGGELTEYGVEFARTVTVLFRGNHVELQFDDHTDVRPYIKPTVSRPVICHPTDPLPPHHGCGSGGRCETHPTDPLPFKQ